MRHVGYWNGRVRVVTVACTVPPELVSILPHTGSAGDVLVADTARPRGEVAAFVLQCVGIPTRVHQLRLASYLTLLYDLVLQAAAHVDHQLLGPTASNSRPAAAAPTGRHRRRHLARRSRPTAPALLCATKN